MSLFVHACTGYVRDVVEVCRHVDHEQERQGGATQCMHVVLLQLQGA